MKLHHALILALAAASALAQTPAACQEADILVVYRKEMRLNYVAFGSDTLNLPITETTKWFYTVEDAVNWLNGKPYDMCHITEEEKKAGKSADPLMEQYASVISKSLK